MKNKLALFAVFTVTSIALLTGCIVVNVERSTPPPPHPMPVKGSATNNSSVWATNSIPQ
ncbi:MAG: hypothetical protein WDM80_12220 [Limisphaerales bacterium]